MSLFHYKQAVTRTKLICFYSSFFSSTCTHSEFLEAHGFFPDCSSLFGGGKKILGKSSSMWLD